MPKLLIITHPEVIVDAKTPVVDWGLSAPGRQRAATFAMSQAFADVSHICSSAEQKARDTAEILAARRGIPIRIEPRLGENDRSATGFLPPAEFEAAADRFFAVPEVSFRGWETAVQAQTRICEAVDALIKEHTGRDLAIVTHGAVGTLLWCALSGLPIDRSHDQPFQGHFWEADLTAREPTDRWRSIG